MASPESINQLLVVAARLLDRAASEIRDAELDPVLENIDHVARALVEVFEIQRSIYRIRPDLEPAWLTEETMDPEADRLLTGVLAETYELELSGNHGEAIERLEEFLELCSSDLHRGIATGEIARLREDL